MISEVASTLFTEEIYRIDSKTVVVISEPWDKIRESERELLEKILHAVGLTTNAVIITHQPAFSINTLRQKASRIVCFGLSIDGVTPLEASSTEGIAVITSPSLEQLQGDSTAKQKLWAGLKILFGR